MKGQEYNSKIKLKSFVFLGLNYILYFFKKLKEVINEKNEKTKI